MSAPLWGERELLTAFAKFVDEESKGAVPVWIWLARFETSLGRDLTSGGDTVRLDWLMRNVSGAEYRRMGIHYADGCSRDLIDAAIEVDGTRAPAEPEKLARFGHHPDPVIDFCVEVEAIEGEAVDLAAGLKPTMDIDARIFRAMYFRVGLDERALNAKAMLRKLESGRALASPEGVFFHRFDGEDHAVVPLAKWRRIEATLVTLAAPVADPLDTPLPVNFTAAGATFRKGLPLRLIAERIERLWEAAHGPMPTPEQQAANLARLQGKEPVEPDSTAMFEFIRHGDAAHQDWLRRACEAFVLGEPRPPIDPAGAQVGEPVSAGEGPLTDDELHDRHRHPNFEYATTTGPRKAWSDQDRPPEGDGWEANVTVKDPDAWERFDYHEESYWRRLKASGGSA